MYRDLFTLYETTLERNPASWVAHLNLGTALDEAGRPEQSLPHLQRALELKPDFPETLNSLGDVLNQLGRPREALPLLEQALRIQPRFAAAHNTLGVTLMAIGRANEGIAVADVVDPGDNQESDEGFEDVIVKRPKELGHDQRPKGFTMGLLHAA